MRHLAVSIVLTTMSCVTYRMYSNFGGGKDKLKKSRSGERLSGCMKLHRGGYKG